MTINTLTSEQVQLVQQHCKGYTGDRDELVALLTRIQDGLGCVSPQVQQLVATTLGVDVAVVNDIVSFYAFFRERPKEKHGIAVCVGAGCYARGAKLVIEELERQLGVGLGDTTTDGLFSLRTSRCMGACGLAPVLMVGRKLYSNVQPNDVKAILAEYKA